MGNFLYPVSFVISTELDASSAVPAASADVASKKKHGRHAVAISATSAPVYIGGEDVSSSTGMPVAADTTVIIPVVPERPEPVYVVGGTCIITEFF